MGHKGKQPGGWKRRLQDLIDANNERHSTRGKVVGYKTQNERAASFFRIFKQLREMGFKIEDPVAELAAHGVRYEPRNEPLSPAYILQQLSLLRVLRQWIGKPGLVLPADAFVARRQRQPASPWNRRVLRPPYAVIFRDGSGAHNTEFRRPEVFLLPIQLPLPLPILTNGPTALPALETCRP